MIDDRLRVLERSSASGDMDAKDGEAERLAALRDALAKNG